MTLEPKALKMPDELWLHILHDPALTYSDLKCLSRVCKKLHDLFLVSFGATSATSKVPTGSCRTPHSITSSSVPRQLERSSSQERT